MNSRQFRVSGLSMLLLMIALLFFARWIANMDMGNVYTYDQFETDVENGQVVSAVIQQSEAVPTGTVRLTMKDGAERQINVPDTVEARELLQQNGAVVSFTQVRGESLFGSVGISLLVSVAVVAVMMIFLNRQNGGSGGKMMDFGRSRARMTTQEQIHTTFKDVAGKIDAEIKRIVDECYEKAKKIILENRKVLDAAAELLLEKEKISREEFEALFEENGNAPEMA